jgi:hypothetical protein
MGKWVQRRQKVILKGCFMKDDIMKIYPIESMIVFEEPSWNAKSADS